MSADYTNGSQLRLCALIRLLRGNEFLGVAPNELAKALAVTPSTITRDLFNLKKAGFAESLATGRWRLGPELVQTGLAFAAHVAETSDALSEMKQRFTREI